MEKYDYDFQFESNLLSHQLCCPLAWTETKPIQSDIREKADLAPLTNSLPSFILLSNCSYAPSSDSLLP